MDDDYRDVTGIDMALYQRLGRADGRFLLIDARLGT